MPFIGVVDTVVHIVDDAGNCDLHLLHHHLRRRTPLPVIFVVRDTFVLGEFHRPVAAGRMGFSDINDAEFSDIPVILVHFAHLAQLGAKRRSGVTAEKEYHRLLLPEILQSEFGCSIQGFNGEYRGHLPGFRGSIVLVPVVSLLRSFGPSL